MCEDCWGPGDKTTLCVTALAPPFLFTLLQAVTSKVGGMPTGHGAGGHLHLPSGSTYGPGPLPPAPPGRSPATSRSTRRKE